MQLYPPEHYDDAANGLHRIRTQPLATAMGAEILDVDLGNLDDEQFEEIKASLFRYKMIYFRNQNIQVEDQENLTMRFGEFGTDAYTEGMEGHPNVQHVIKEAGTVVNRVFGEGWHVDSPFMERPPSISLLRSVDIPPLGGDTWWANAQLAYEFLSDAMKKLIADLKVHMSAEFVVQDLMNSQGEDYMHVGEIELTMDQKRIIDGWFHPMVRTHPDTGQKSLYVDQIYARGIQGFTREEAAPLLDYLGQHVARPEFTCRLRWEPDMLVIWDNRICQHKAFNDYDGYRREMYRTIVNGEVPA